MSILTSRRVTVRGVVTCRLLAQNGVDGYFMHDSNGDDDPAISDALYLVTNLELPRDHLVQIVGKVEKYFAVPALKQIEMLIDCAIGPPVDVTIEALSPKSGQSRFESSAQATYLLRTTAALPS